MTPLHRTNLIAACVALAGAGLWLAGLSDAGMLVVGLVLLVVGADWLVEGAVSIAHRMGVSALVIGLTVVSYGTSAPEMAAGVAASSRDEGPIVVGNVIGSNIANVWLILAIMALIRPVMCRGAVVRRDVPIMILVCTVGMFAMAWGVVGRIEGALLLLGAVGYTALMFLIGRRDPHAFTESVGHEAEVLYQVPATKGSWRGGLTLVVLGIGALALGSELLVRGAVGMATTIGISKAAVGLTMVAVGTSLPELVTSIAASVKRQNDLAVGNIVGSNVFNILAVLGISALVHPVHVPNETITRDMWVMLAVSVVCLPVMLTGSRVSRLEGVFMLGAYITYVVLVFL
ncbi:MAG: calcium/sodium antiporter [Phycisphaeraceae bacterium]|nr:calcium/sodium antiporter [Phycisphaeraceae bacterium]